MPDRQHVFAKKAAPSATLAVAEITKALGGIAYGAGQLSVANAPEVLEVGSQAFLRQQTGYTAASGMSAVKMTAALMYRQQLGIEYDWRTQIGLRGGGKGVCTNVIGSLLTTNPDPANSSYDGNNVALILEDQWLSYAPMIANNGVIKTIPSPATQDYKATAQQLGQAVELHRPKLYIEADPGNPSGATRTRVEAKDVAAVLGVKLGSDSFVLSEIMYRKMVLDGQSYNHPLQFNPALAENFILSDCISKYAYGHLPGVRVGIMAGPADLMSVFNANVSHDQGNANTPGQWATMAAFLGKEIAMEAMRMVESGKSDAELEKLIFSERALQEYYRMDDMHDSINPLLRNNRDIVVGHLSETQLIVPRPVASFYSYPDMSAYIGYKVPDDLPLYNNTDPSVLKSINEKFNLNLQPMGGQVIKNSTDFCNFLLLHCGIGVVDGAEFNPVQSQDADGKPSTTFRLSFSVSKEKLEEGLPRIVDGVNQLIPTAA